MTLTWVMAVERYVAQARTRGFSPRTIERRRDLLAAFVTYAVESGAAAPDRLTGAIVEGYRLFRREKPNRRGRRDAPSTVAQHLAATRQFLKLLGAQGIVAPSLFEKVGTVRIPYRLPGSIPTDEEIRHMLAAVDLTQPWGLRDRAILEVLYSTGVRSQELLALVLDDVDLEGGTLHVRHGKGDKERMVPLGRQAADWLRRYVLVGRPHLVRRSDPGSLFVSSKGGMLGAHGLREMIVQAARRAGVGRRITTHSLRRACATELVKAGAPLYPIKELLGHESLLTLRRYARLTINDVREAHRKYHPRERQQSGGPP